MRTRTSPRNQDILFSALFKPAAQPERSKVEVLEACLASPHLKPRDRKAFEKQLATARMKEAISRAIRGENSVRNDNPVRRVEKGFGQYGSTVTFKLPAYWASYLFNGDASGIEDVEREQADAFMAKEGNPILLDVGEPYFSWHNDADYLGGPAGLGGDVADYTAWAKGEKGTWRRSDLYTRRRPSLPYSRHKPMRGQNPPMLLLGNPGGSSGGSYVVTRDGQVKATFTTETEAWSFMHKQVGYSIDHAVRFEGWNIIYPDGQTLREMQTMRKIKNAERGKSFGRGRNPLDEEESQDVGMRFAYDLDRYHAEKKLGNRETAMYYHGRAQAFSEVPVLYGKWPVYRGLDPSGLQRKQNPPSAPADPVAARELELFIENDADLWRSQGNPIIKNLMTKWARGVYDRELAVQLFMYLMESGAKKYLRPGERIDRVFNRNTRLEVARRFRDAFEAEARSGAYGDDYLPKKYAGFRPNGGRGRNPSEPPVDVYFRVDKGGKFKGDVTAVFPTEVADNKGNVMCYAHVGQHGACSLSWMAHNTLEALPAEYAPLKRELESIGYNLKVRSSKVVSRLAKYCPCGECGLDPSRWSAACKRESGRQANPLKVFGVPVGGWDYPAASPRLGRKGAYFAGQNSTVYRGESGGYNVHLRSAGGGPSRLIAHRTLGDAMFESSRHELAMKAEGRGRNPLTYEESGILRDRSSVLSDAGNRAISHSRFGEAARRLGMAAGIDHVVSKAGPRKMEMAARHASVSEMKDASWAARRADEKRNQNPAILPPSIENDPRFKAELKSYRKKHGNDPVAVYKVNVPAGFPKYMTAWGTTPEILYDATKASTKGKRRHEFGERGGKPPYLVSSVEKGPKFLSFAGGTFKAGKEWILK